MSNQFSRLGIRNFRLDTRLVSGGFVKELAPASLRLYTTVVYRMHKIKKTSVLITDDSVTHATGISHDEIRQAQRELANSGLLRSKVFEQRATYTLLGTEPV